MSRGGVAERVRDQWDASPFGIVDRQLGDDGRVRSDVCDDLDREAYCVLGVPIDAIDMDRAVGQIRNAARARRRFLVSTPNLNFLVNSRSDVALRESVLESDLCTADGTPIIWIARCLDLPIEDRVAGSDILDNLQEEQHSASPLKLFLFGGADGVAEIARGRINRAPTGLRCVGTLQPGYGSVEQMSASGTIETINSSDADFLVVALGAAKGQAWLRRNDLGLTVPVRSHFGAAVNFQAGTVKRAPTVWQKVGLEWLWRIKEEPYLWRRYVHDGCVLLKLFFTQIFPLMVEARWQQHSLRTAKTFLAAYTEDRDGKVFTFAGAAIAANVKDAIKLFKQGSSPGRPITIDMAAVTAVDARFIGALLMLRKVVEGRGGCLNFTPVSPYLKRMLRLHGVEYLLKPGKENS